jgi:hypothetical protein
MVTYYFIITSVSDPVWIQAGQNSPEKRKILRNFMIVEEDSVGLQVSIFSLIKRKLSLVNLKKNVLRNLGLDPDSDWICAGILE